MKKKIFVIAVGAMIAFAVAFAFGMTAAAATCLFLMNFCEAGVTALRKEQFFLLNLGIGNLFNGVIALGVLYLFLWMPAEICFYLQPEFVKMLQVAATCNVLLGIGITVFSLIDDFCHSKLKKHDILYWDKLFELVLLVILLATAFMWLSGWMDLNVFSVPKDIWMTAGFVSIGAVVAYIIYLGLHSIEEYDDIFLRLRSALNDIDVTMMIPSSRKFRKEPVRKRDVVVVVSGYLLCLFGGAFVASLLIGGYTEWSMPLIPVILMFGMAILITLIKEGAGMDLFGIISIGSAGLFAGTVVLNKIAPMDLEILKATITICVVMTIVFVIFWGLGCLWHKATNSKPAEANTVNEE